MISTKQVAIAYTFFNRSPRAKTIMVAFPMPDIVGADSDGELAMPTDNSNNIKVTSDGVQMPLHLEQKAVIGGLDQTARLRQLHIPARSRSACRRLRSAIGRAALPRAA